VVAIMAVSLVSRPRLASICYAPVGFAMNRYSNAGMEAEGYPRAPESVQFPLSAV
jgi:hypothetical protein